MMFLFVILLVAGYAVAASWAAPHGRNRLWLTAIASILLIVVASAFLGRHYTVPSLPSLLLYAVALTGPIVFVPTTMLSLTIRTRSTLATALPTAVLGACLGFACGFVIVVFGLRVW
jgi:hypothetical protein